MAGFIDIACNFTHESFKDNLETVILNAEIEQVEKFVLLCASLKDLEPIKEIQKSAPQKFFTSAGIHPDHAIEVIDMDSQDFFESSQPLPTTKFVITNGEVWDLKVRTFGKSNKGLYGQKFLNSLLTETSLAVIDLSKPNELEGDIEDSFRCNRGRYSYCMYTIQ